MRDTNQHECIGKVATCLLAITCLIVSVAWTVRAAPGDLDPTFGNGGRLTDWSGEARRVAIQPDGKIVVAGTSPYPWDIAVARYNPDGAPDTTFGLAGKVRVTILSLPFGTPLMPSGLAIQQDGRIVVACDDDDQGFGALVRFNPDGSFDASFGTNGVVHTSYPIGILRSVSIQTDGKIIASGAGLRRHNSDGSPDTSFGNDGILDLPGWFPASIIQPDGKILAAGANNTNGMHIVGRCNPDGSLDTTFGTGGFVTTQVGSGWSPAHSIALQTDGKIVVAGPSNAVLFDGDLVLVRYNSNGSLDPTFGGTGIVTSPIRTGDAGRTVVIQPNGQIVAAGWLPTGSTADFASVRYNQDGSLDTTFGGGDGISTVDFNNSRDNAQGMELDNQGRAVVVGISSSGSDSQFALARLLPHQTPFDFDGDGRSDVSVFRPSDSVWYLSRSTQGFFATQFGLPTDKIVPADYDGDGRTDIAVFRDGTWWLRKSSSGAVEAIQFGVTGDIPVPADYTGDGRSELAIFRNGAWWALDLSNNQSSLLNFGLPTDRPVRGDYDGDGRVDQAVYRNGEWHLNRSTQGYTVINFGLASDRPVVGDYDGDGKSDSAVYRDGTWYVLQSTAGFRAFQWGIGTDIPAPADYDGDGRTDIAVYRQGTWYIVQSSNGTFRHEQFGLSTDIPLAGIQ